MNDIHYYSATLGITLVAKPWEGRPAHTVGIAVYTAANHPEYAAPSLRLGLEIANGRVREAARRRNFRATLPTTILESLLSVLHEEEDGLDTEDDFAVLCAHCRALKHIAEAGVPLGTRPLRLLHAYLGSRWVEESPRCALTTRAEYVE